MKYDKYTKPQLIFFSVLSFALSLVLIFFANGSADIPSRSLLQSVSGTVSWAKSDKYGVDFRIQNESRAFNYASKGGEMGLVYDSISQADSPEVTVLFDANDASGPVYSNDVYFPVYELHVSGEPIRTYEQILEGWQADDQLLYWLVGLFILIGIFLSFSAYRLSRER